MDFHVEPPDLDPPEPGEGPWGLIGRLIFIVGLVLAMFAAYKYLR